MPRCLAARGWYFFANSMQGLSKGITIGSECASEFGDILASGRNRFADATEGSGRDH